MKVNSFWKAALFTGASFAVLYGVLMSAVMALRIPLGGQIFTLHLYTSPVMWLSSWRIYDYSISTFFLLGLIEGACLYPKANESIKQFIIYLSIAFVITFVVITLLGFMLMFLIGYVGP